MGSTGTLLVLGAGPGLGMSVARRFGGAGYAVGLVSRGADRHDGYLTDLGRAGVHAFATAADARDPGQLHHALDVVESALGPIDVLYCGPGADNPAAYPVDILQTGPGDVLEAVAAAVSPAVEATNYLLPAMTKRGTGALVYVTGLSAVVPLPFLGPLAPASAALRTYALTVAEAVAPRGIQAGALVVGGLIERGDIHRLATAAAPDGAYPTLDPDDLADAVWRIAIDGEREIVASALPVSGT
ncbi:SDR family NAD(P)-dependent oxidoreductase [Pseudofrankia saprophytica]|uniref:SDR family NAD(P)-dependent oxidoreductase n=1 Tax=Pseudofrankia saprophytica TaxID=298655 RepID=UPI000234D3CD|nr:SDR family NAD(P)-dependent oxidoreductase [Pseudofrankia saprophytica]